MARTRSEWEQEIVYATETWMGRDWIDRQYGSYQAWRNSADFRAVLDRLEREGDAYWKEFHDQVKRAAEPIWRQRIEDWTRRYMGEQWIKDNYGSVEAWRSSSDFQGVMASVMNDPFYGWGFEEQIRDRASQTQGTSYWNETHGVDDKSGPAGDSKFSEDAYERLRAVLDRYELPGLTKWLWDQMQAGEPEDAIFLAMRDTPEYQARYPGMAAMRAAGLPAMNEASYLAHERSYREIARMYGAPDGMLRNPADFTKLFATGYSIGAFEQASRIARDLEAWGIDKAKPWLWSQIANATSLADLTKGLRQNPEYKARFSGLEAMEKAGLTRISEDEYINRESAFRSILETYGAPKEMTDKFTDFANFFAKGITPATLERNARLIEDARRWNVDKRLETWMWQQVGAGVGHAEMYEKLKENQIYKRRFPGMGLREAAGLDDITEDQYLQLESAYRSEMRRAGLDPDRYDDPSDFAGLFSNDIDPREFAERADLLQAIQQAPETTARIQRLFREHAGLGDVGNEKLFDIVLGTDVTALREWEKKTGQPLNIGAVQQSFRKAVMEEAAVFRGGGGRAAEDRRGRVGLLTAEEEEA